MKKNNKGFTLVELIVVLVILAILAAILTPALLGYIDRARAEKDYSTAQTIRVAAQAAIDQAYGDGVLTTVVDPANPTTAEKVSNINGMEVKKGWEAVVALDSDGKPQTDTDGSLKLTKGGKYAKLVFTLSSVDPSVVTEFNFCYEKGIITKGYVVINNHIYVLEGGSWSTAETKPNYNPTT